LPTFILINQIEGGSLLRTMWYTVN